jgi:hypothetical protein
MIPDETNKDAARQKVIDRLAKLKRHAESAEKIGSEAEAQAFAAMVQQLLLKHNLDMTDLEYEATVDAEPVGVHYINYAKHPRVKIRHTRVLWIEQLAGVIARAHHCRILTHSGTSRVSLIGRKSNCEIAEYMFVVMQRQMERISHAAWWAAHRERLKNGLTNEDARAELLGFRSAFLSGFIARLEERYNEERRTTEQSYSSGWALMRLDMKPVDDFIEAQHKSKNFGTAGRLTRRVSTHAEGHRAGRNAADDAILKAKAMKDGGAKKLTE